MADAFDEVEERIRQDNLAKFARVFGPWLVGAFIATLIGVGGYEAWKHFGTTQSAAAGERLLAAQMKAEGGDVAGAKAEFEALAKSGPQGVRALALMEKAGALQAEGDLKAAAAAMEEAAKLSRDPLMKDLATLKAAYLAADQLDVKALDALVKPLIDGKGPYSFQARELIGMQALAAGDEARARAEFEFLSLALGAPEGVRTRAQSALGMLGPKPAAPAPAAPAAAAPPADAAKAPAKP